MASGPAASEREEGERVGCRRGVDRREEVIIHHDISQGQLAEELDLLGGGGLEERESGEGVEGVRVDAEGWMLDG